MAIISTGQISIIDYNDAITLTGFVSANQPTTQMYNPDNGTYSPSWAASPYMVLTPSLFVAGSSTDVIASTNVKSIKWYDKGTEIVNGGNYTLAAFTSGQNRPLTIKANILTGSTNAKDFVCEVEYLDPTTQLSVVCKFSISVSKVVNGGGVVIVNTYAPDGNIFKQGSATTLKAQADLMRGAVTDTSSVTYQWYRQNPAVSVDEGGGIGWDKLDATTNYGTTGYTTATLSVPAAAVTNVTTFKCVIKDTDSASPSYNQYFYNTITFIDQTDAIQVSVVSTGGDVFKNGDGTSQLTAKLFQGGSEVDSGGTAYTYKWYKYDKNGIKDAAFAKTGKTITVTGADVDIKATFVIEVE